MLHQINDQNINKDFERNFINLTILSKNNENKKKILRVYYLRNIPRFSKEVRDTVLSN